MQNLKKLMIGAFLTMASLMQAQFVGGGSDENLRDYKAGSDSPWRNRFYLFGGPSMPMGAWGKEVDSEATLSAMYSNNAGFGAQRGWYAEMGSMFYLKKLALPENMGIAINFTYFQIALNKYVPFATPQNNPLETPYRDFVFVNSKLGATYTYSLFADVCADAYFNLCPGFHNLPNMTSSSSNKFNYQYNVDSKSAFATRKNFGLALRYKALTVGVDFMVGKFNVTNDISIYDNRTNSYILNDGPATTKFRANSTQIRLGFTL
jgi:hypothetical protein